MRNLRFVLEDLNDRGRAVEPNRLSPTGGGFTGLEALLQYFFVQSQAINIYDSKGFLLKLNVLLNECSQYTNAQTAIENPERTAHCKQWLGPNQPGVTTGAVSRTTPNKPRRAPRAATSRRAADAGAGRAPIPAQSAGPPPPPPPPPRAEARPARPARPAAAARHQRQPAAGAAPEGRLELARRAPTSERNLLDYLLGP